MTCRRAQDLLAPLVDGELDDAGTRALNDHLSGCQACAEELRALLQIQSALRNMPQRSCPDTVWTGLQERIAKAPAPLLRPQRYAAGMPTWTFGVALVVGIGLVSPYTPFQSADLTPTVEPGARYIHHSPAPAERTAMLPPAAKITRMAFHAPVLKSDPQPVQDRTPAPAQTVRPAAPALHNETAHAPRRASQPIVRPLAAISHTLIAARFTPIQPHLELAVQTQPASGSLAPSAPAPPATQAIMMKQTLAQAPHDPAASTAGASSHGDNQEISGMVTVAENASQSDAALAQAGKDLWSVAVNAPTDHTDDPSSGA